MKPFLMRESHPDRRMLGPAQGMPLDESPYGLRGMAGNVVDWTRDPYSEELPGSAYRPRPAGEVRLWTAKGGGWLHRQPGCSAAARWQIGPWIRRPDLGIRVLQEEHIFPH